MHSKAIATFKGALGALKWLRDNDFEEREGVWSRGAEKAFVADGNGCVDVILANPGSHHHARAVCTSIGQPRFNNTSWSRSFICPVCKTKKSFNTNFLGGRELVCFGEGTFRKMAQDLREPVWSWAPLRVAPRQDGWYVVEMQADDGDGITDVWRKTLHWSKKKQWEGSTLNGAYYYTKRYPYEVDCNDAPERP